MPPPDRSAIFALDRPHSRLLVRYVLGSLALGPFFFVVLIPAVIRFSTLRYRFDAEGISMRWGLFFRREINLTYARIQDIHLSSGLIERWLGLARIEIQTASGSASAEMTVEGLLEYEQVRDFLYANMRGTRASLPAAGSSAAGQSGGLGTAECRELTEALQATAAELRAIRALLTPPPEGGEGNG